MRTTPGGTQYGAPHCRPMPYIWGVVLTKALETGRLHIGTNPGPPLARQRRQGLALLGGIQINTGPDTDDYFHPLRFDYYDSDGNLVGSMLSKL